MVSAVNSKATFNIQKDFHSVLRVSAVKLSSSQDAEKSSSILLELFPRVISFLFFEQTLSLLQN